MFATQMSEKDKSVVNISDIEFEVMQELIRYIYTEQVEKLKLNRLATPLLLAADKVSYLE
jgi:hypothetical protein